jgi:hypothetical protein
LIVPPAVPDSAPPRRSGSTAYWETTLPTWKEFSPATLIDIEI